jgi:hypothetical protein
VLPGSPRPAESTQHTAGLRRAREGGREGGMRLLRVVEYRQEVDTVETGPWLWVCRTARQYVRTYTQVHCHKSGPKRWRVNLTEADVPWRVSQPKRRGRRGTACAFHCGLRKPAAAAAAAVLHCTALRQCCAEHRSPRQSTANHAMTCATATHGPPCPSFGRLPGGP